MNNQQINLSIDDKLIFLVGVKNIGMAFRELVASHPAAKDLHKEIMAAWFALGTLFNKAAELHHQAKVDAPGNPPGHIPTRTNYWLEADAVGLGDAQEYPDVKVGVGHYHEMMDRAHCVEDMFDMIVVDHRAAEVLTTEVDLAAEALADLYQAAASLHHEKATAEEKK